MQNVLVIDNYDSFTFNLVHYLEDLGCHVSVWRNDDFDIKDVDVFDRIVLSPGPGIPEESGQLMELIQSYAPYKRILGVCLGQQAIAEVFGGTIVNLDQVFHGVASTIKVLVQDEPLFNGLNKEFSVGRYHSWVVHTDLPDALEATSIDQNGQIMSLRHRDYDVKAVQFHPESILTPDGMMILKNWLNY